MFPQDTALILVDLQVDFMPSGMLPVPEGDRVIDIANELIPEYHTVVATQDWHPANHGSFAANHMWRKPGQVIELNGLPQVLWPIHCVQDTWGSEFVQGLHTEKIDKVFRKGTDPSIDSYSGFFDNGHRKATGMSEWLKEHRISTIHVMGLALDYCVKFTVLDGLEEGFAVTLLRDGTRPVELAPGDGQAAVEAMRDAGATIS